VTQGALERQVEELWLETEEDLCQKIAESGLQAACETWSEALAIRESKEPEGA